MEHQYVERATGRVMTERLTADRWVNLLYAEVRENIPFLFRTLTGARASSLFGELWFDRRHGSLRKAAARLMRQWGVDPAELYDDPTALNTPEKLFCRRIRYWETRPLPADAKAVVAAADSRVLVGSLRETSALYVKNKFFSFEELLGADKSAWLDSFAYGDFALFRLTPDKYHYNHVPASGLVLDYYDIEGAYHSCNPEAVVRLVTPYSKNKRTVTILDTDQPGGTGCGLVAMIEVAALMIGDIYPCYSEERYDQPRPVRRGMFLKRGRPKSLFRPGSSTVILLFEPERVRFEEDLVANQRVAGVKTRFSAGFGRPLVETDLRVRSSVGRAVINCY